jgi:serine protease Do
VALLRTETAHERLPTARLGRSAPLRVGDYVVAVGNPFGLDHTVTQGIISARGRMLGVGPEAPLLQTDASINPGNSGGPLYDLDGRVIALNTAIVANAHGIGFALPVDVIRRALPQLERDGHISRGSLGVKLTAVPLPIARALGADDARTGALVADVQPGGPGATAGIVPGDVIVRWDGDPIDGAENLPWMIALTPPGTTVDVALLRDGDAISTQVLVGPAVHR